MHKFHESRFRQRENVELSAFDNINFHEFVDGELKRKNCSIKPVTEEYLRLRLEEIMTFVNDIRAEYSQAYGWSEETREYFLNPMDRKCLFSFLIEKDQSGEICFTSFASVYDDRIHVHFTYAKEGSRSVGLGKLHSIKLCQTGLDHGFTRQECYIPKHNNNSISFYMKMGWKIESMRNEQELFLAADLKEVRDQTYRAYLKEDGGTDKDSRSKDR